MKFIKYSIISLLVAVATDATLVAATKYPTPPTTFIIEQLAANGSVVYTRWLTKNVNGAQTYYNTYTATWLNSPCKKCQVAVKPYIENGDSWEGFFSTMDMTHEFNNNMSYVHDELIFGEAYNNYRLGINRVGPTLLTTYHNAEWTINPQ